MKIITTILNDDEEIVGHAETILDSETISGRAMDIERHLENFHRLANSVERHIEEQGADLLEEERENQVDLEIKSIKEENI